MAPALSKQALLRRLVESPDLTFLIEAHDGLSARIAQDAGFEGLWASGLAISAALGVRDANEASWTQVLDVIEFMADATTIPILMDADTGYGNFNNVRRLVAKAEPRGVAGICIEDKLFPKTNSFLHGETQPLADPEEFAGRIRAAKDTQRDRDFIVVARTEAFIAGHGLSDALLRAHTYADAGADAILVHSAKRTADEVVSFKRAWDRDLPIVLVPTTYAATPTAIFRHHRFATVIWANHLVRASITAMQTAAARIAADQSVGALDASIASVADIFELQRTRELEDAERQYLPKASPLSSAVNQ